MLRRFAAFPEIQVIDLDAAMGRGPMMIWVRLLASKAVTRVGGSVRSPERALAPIRQGARKVIAYSAAFTGGGINGRIRSQGRAGIDAAQCRRGTPFPGAILLGLPVHVGP